MKDRDVAAAPIYQRNRAARLRAALIGSTALLFSATGVSAQEFPPLPRNNYGSVGLVDMPSARMAPDGELSAGAFFAHNTQRYVLGFQALPWLEASFRYSGLENFHPLYPVYYDRSFALKLRLWEEGDLLPAFAVGINDVVGTGVYGSEYIVLSKSFGPVDATLGMGWGRMGSTGLLRNPFSLLSSSFDVRTSSAGAGATNFSTLFHGRDVGIFGGLTWTTPVDGLALIGEYSSDAYLQENATGAFRPRNQFNFGASYQLSSGVHIGINWLYGNSIAANLLFQMNPAEDTPVKLGPPMPSPSLRTGAEQQMALAGILSARNGASVLPAARVISYGEMVDALWQPDTVSSVASNGQIMTLSLYSGDPQAVCKRAAQIVGLHGTGFTQVQAALNGRVFSCPVTAQPVITMPPSKSLYFAKSRPATPENEPMVIDSTGRSGMNAGGADRRIRNAAAAQSLPIMAMTLKDGVATVQYINQRYQNEADALDRMVRMLMAEAPPEIERFELVATKAGHPIREFTIQRSSLERDFEQSGQLSLEQNLRAGPPSPVSSELKAQQRRSYPSFSWDLFPQFRQALFDPSNPFGVQLLASASGTVDILPGLSATGQAEFSLIDNFEVSRPSDSVLPHVRTDFVKYFIQGKNGIANLEMDYRFRLASETFGIVRAGYLEPMFAGVGGELLFRPEGARWALGADLYALRQRKFDRLFGLQPYEVVTGHISFYYQSPWYGLNMNFRIGRYLAGDYGATFELTRRFDSGVEIGAFFTKTNVSSAQFGEGSFDKGIIIRLPLSWVTPLETQNQFAMDLRPVQRDGGQRLQGDTMLYEDTRRQFEGMLARPSNW